MILVKVSGCDLTAKPLHSVTSGTVGRMVSFEFSPEWAELVKTAVFKGSGTARDVALLASDTCTIPLDVLDEHGGDLEIGVYGRNEAGTVVMPTVWGRIEYIREGVTLSDADPSEPAPDWTAQVQAAAASALEKAEAVEAAAARGDFDGEDGFSPAVTITTVTGGHTVTITDKDHPAGQSFDVLDGSGGGGGGGGGTGNYNDLLNKPQINSVPLSGNLSASDLGLAAASAIPTKTSDLTNDSGFLTSAPVTSVNGEDGDVVLTQDDIGSGSTYARTHNDYTDADKAAVGTISGKQAAITANGILKGNGTGTVTAAEAGTDYQAPLGVTGATAGQYVKIKTVDASGVPTAYEAGTPSGGGSSGPDPYTSDPANLGTKSPGSSTNYSRGDHVHQMPSAADVGAQAKITASGILKGNGSGGVSAATAGTDYQAAITASGILKGTGSAVTAATAGTDYQAAITASGLLKGNGSGGVSAATAGTDYQAAITASGILKGTGSGVTAATAGTDYQAPLGVTGASAGQYVKIKTVDGSGKPTAYEAGTPSSGSSVSPYTYNPADLGTANPGSSSDYARGDHVHKKPTLSDLGAAAAGLGITGASSGKLVKISSVSSGVPTAYAAATAGTDYQAPITATGILTRSSGGVIDGAEAGWDYTLILSGGSVTLYEEDWDQISNWGGVSVSDLYAQTVTDSSMNQYTKVDVQADPAAYAQLINDGVQVLFAGTQYNQSTNKYDIVFYALGGQPSEDIDVQYTYYDIR